jgi:hypothetical protein
MLRMKEYQNEILEYDVHGRTTSHWAFPTQTTRKRGFHRRRVLVLLENAEMILFVWFNFAAFFREACFGSSSSLFLDRSLF